MRYLVTGGTGFLGRAVLARLLAREDCDAVYALVRRASVDKLRRRTRELDGADKLVTVTGDLTAERLGLTDETVIDLAGQIDEVLHLGAIYDVTADDAANRSANVDGTRHVVAVTAEIGARCLHHVSSVAVAGEHTGGFTEDDFDLGQEFGNPYHETKFAAEKIVREESGTAWRVYRPAVVVGDSQTGQMDKIDGPYYLMGAISALGHLPSLPFGHSLRVPAPELGATNVA